MASKSQPAPRSVTPERQIVKIWPTPNESDLLFYVERQGALPKNKTFTYGAAFYNAVVYPNHKLVHVTPEDADGWSRWYYAADRLVEDAYNWEYSQADIGGQKFDSVLRTHLVLRTAFSVSSPAVGATMPNVPVGKFTGTYVLAARSQIRTGDEIFDSLYVVDRRNYVKKATITDIRWDEATSSALATVQTLYYRGETIGGDAVEDLFGDNTDSFWAVQSVGSLRDGQQISDNWFLVIERDVVPELTDGSIEIRRYIRYVGQSLPAVLYATDPVEMMDWVMKDGASRYYPRVRYYRHAFSGEVRAEVVETWYINEPTLSGIQHLMPLPITYACPFYALNIGPTLHGTVTLYADTGTEDPVWGVNSGSSRTFPTTQLVTEAATVGDSTTANASDWPDSLKVADDPSPFRGGWLRREITLDLTFVKKGTVAYA